MAEPFRVVKDETDAPQADSLSSIGIQTLMLGLGALTQRTVVAISRLFTLLTVASAFWLWMSIPRPDVYQLVELGGYAVFVLAANFIVRK